MPWSAWGPVGNGRSTGLSVPILPTPEKNRRDRLIRLAAQHADIGVPVAGVQKTTICAFTVEGEEKNEGHHPHIRWTKIPDLVHVYCGISSINRVFFPTLFGLPRTPHSDCHGLSNRLINTNTSRRSLFFAPKLREPPPRQTSPISLGRKCPLCPSPPIREPWEAGRSKQGRGADADKRAFSRT